MYEIDTARVRSPLDRPSFDMPDDSTTSPHSASTKHTKPAAKSIEDELDELGGVIKLKPPPKRTWEPDVKSMISSAKWLSTHGLTKNRLTLQQILPLIGFRHADDFDAALGRPVCSIYGEGMFPKYPNRNGKVYNISVSRERIRQLESSLLAAVVLYKRRIEWLTTESRRLFGVIEEHCVCLVLDIKTSSPAHFDHCRNAIIAALQEQVARIAKFNLIRAGRDLVCFQEGGAVPVCRESIEQAVAWVRGLDSVAPSSQSGPVEAIKTAFQDKQIEAVYLFSEGGSTETARELTRSKVKGGPLPVHTVGFNNPDSVTVKYLKDVAAITGGRHHFFAFTKLDADVHGRSGYNMAAGSEVAGGGVPPGAGQRGEVLKLWTELEEARSTLADIQTLMLEVPDTRPNAAPGGEEEGEGGPPGSEHYMSSDQWLDRHGLRPMKLNFYDALASVAFKHCDGVVDLKQPPHNTIYTDSVSKNKLVNAQYCDKFCHVIWRDGSVKHVHITADVHRDYEKRMKITLDNIQARIDWLQLGSRELFGTIVEEQVYILIDVSNSMEPHLGLVKEKLVQLMEEQLRHKMRFNLIKFGSKAVAWRDRLVEVSEANLRSAWQWVRGLSVAGSTNTLGALKLALGDPSTQAVYLLTDGRPDLPPKTVLAQVQLQNKVPINAISFNCDDKEANTFLSILARDTGGRYHYYRQDGNPDPDGPAPFESEDVRLLKEELERGRRWMAKMGQLRAECASLDWTNSRLLQQGCGKDHSRSQPKNGGGMLPNLIGGGNGSSMTPSSLYDALPPSMSRPMSAISPRPPTSSHKQCRPRTASSPEPKSFKDYKPPLIAGHTKTSLLRTLSNGSFDQHLSLEFLERNGATKQWLLPETRQMFERQWRKQATTKQVENKLRRPTSSRKTSARAKVDPLKMSSRRWLKTYGLKARKLTILDAVALAALPSGQQRPLDRDKLRRLFEELMPISGAAAVDSQLVAELNPSGADLLGYEEKLGQAVRRYQKRLTHIVWRVLTPSERELFGGHEAVPFQENRAGLLEALERLGWPLPRHDLDLLERELAQAAAYLQRSQELRQALQDSALHDHNNNGHQGESEGATSDQSPAPEDALGGDEGAPVDQDWSDEEEPEPTEQGQGQGRDPGPGAPSSPRVTSTQNYEVNTQSPH